MVLNLLIRLWIFKLKGHKQLSRGDDNPFFMICQVLSQNFTTFSKRTPPSGKIWENDFIKSYLEEVVNSSKKFQMKIKWTTVNLSKNCTWKTLHWYCFHAWKCFSKQEIFATGLTFLVEASWRGKRKKAWKCSWKWNTHLSLHCHQFRKMLWEKGRLLF